MTSRGDPGESGDIARAEPLLTGMVLLPRRLSVGEAAQLPGQILVGLGLMLPVGVRLVLAGPVAQCVVGRLQRRPLAAGTTPSPGAQAR